MQHNCCKLAAYDTLQATPLLSGSGQQKNFAGTVALCGPQQDPELGSIDTCDQLMQTQVLSVTQCSHEG